MEMKEAAAVCRRVSISQVNWINELSSELTLAPIWFPHWPACKCTISRMVMRLLFQEFTLCHEKKTVEVFELLDLKFPNE
jgi:hypothetical protein